MPAETQPSTTAEAPSVLLLHAVTARTSALVTRALEHTGYRLDQWRVLDIVARRGGIAMSALAEAVPMPAPSLTRLVDHLVEDALLYRADDPGDRRRVLVHVSSRGEQVHGRLAALVAAADSEALAALSPDEVAHLRALLGRLNDALTDRDDA